MQKKLLKRFSTLRQRVVTGVILAIFAIAIVFFVPQIWFIAITSIILVLAAWEWTYLAGLEPVTYRIAYLALFILGLLCAWYLPLLPILIFSFCWWIFSLYLVLRYPAQSEQWSKISVRLCFGLIVLIPCWLALIDIRGRDSGPVILFFMCLLIWSADIGAYFAGNWWGKHKLMPAVSPGKTWQGFFGGVALSFLVAWVSIMITNVRFSSTWAAILVVLLLNVFSVMGDLFESMLKRQRNIKDSGQIFPGHGGLLDRGDSLTAAAPMFLLALTLHLVG